MKKNKNKNLAVLAALLWAAPGFAQTPAQATAPTPSAVVKPSAPTAKAPLATSTMAPTAAQAPTVGQNAPLKPCTAVTVDPPTQIVLGKSTVVKLRSPAVRMVVGGLASGRAGRPADAAGDKNAAGAQQQLPAVAAYPEGVADVDLMLLSPTELFFIGKRAGSMNVVLQSADGACAVKDLIVTIDPETLQTKLSEVFPEETELKVRSAENALILTGTVADSVKLEQVVQIATSYGDGKKVVNMMRVASAQQVMLEVVVAEVSKTLLDKLGSSVNLTNGASTVSLISNFLSNGGGLLQALKAGVGTISLDGQKDDGLVRLLAEPNLMAISGQRASFLSGGKIFIPVATNNTGGFTTITLEEKEFGVGVRFTPTVLGGNRINLKVITEVSELSQTGSPFTTLNGVVSVLPSFTVRRADTTVELNDGQSFVVAGLIRNGVNEAVKRVPGLGEIPILGALFRSTEFQTGQTELMFVVTPRLVKPLPHVPRLPTDNHVAPTRAEVYVNGSLERETSTPAANGPTGK